MTQQVLQSMHDDLNDAIGRVQDGDPVLLEYDGKPVAALVSVRDLRLLEQYIEKLEDQIDREEAEKALREIEQEGTTPWETVKRELGLGDE